MRNLTRVFASALLVAAAALPTRSAYVPNALPAETEQVMYVNIKQMLESDIMKKFALGQVKQALGGENAQKVLEEIGLDPLKDLNKATVGLWGTDANNMNAVAVITGKFDADKLLKAAEKYAKDSGDKIAIIEEGKYKLMKITGSSDQGKPFYASVANETTMVGGSDKKLVVTALAAVADKAKPVLNKSLATLVLKQDEKASMWFCGLTEGKLGEVNVPEIPGVDGAALKKSLGKMSTMGLTVRLGADVNLNITMGMKDADAADEFSVTLGKLIDLAKTFLPILGQQQPQAEALIKDFTNTLKAESKDKDVTVKLKLTAEAIGKAVGGAGGDN